MAQGKKYNDDIRERAFALLALNNNCAEVARELKLPYSTVRTWEKKWLKEGEARMKTPHPSPSATPSSQGEGLGVDEERAEASGNNDGRAYDEVKSEDGLNLAQLRNIKKEEFVNNAWRMLYSAQSLLERRLRRAVEDEDKLDEILAAFEDMSVDNDGNGLSDKALRELYRKFSALKLEDVRALSTVLGTLYDKQALAAKEPTAIVDGVVEVKKFEEM